MDETAGYWLSVIKQLQDNGLKVYRNFKTKADLNIVLSARFENPRGYDGKRIAVVETREWFPPEYNGWDNMFRDIVKHYYDDIINVTGKQSKETAKMVIDYIHAEERKADKS